MLKSMTGFGRGFCRGDGREITIELRSVNHKYLDLSFRMPRSLSFAEDVIRDVLSKELARGHVDVVVTYRNTRDDSNTVSVNEGLITNYLALAKEVEVKYDVRNDMSVSRLFKMPEVVTVVENADDEDAVKALVREATTGAVHELISMREKEGEKLKADFKVKLDELTRIREELLKLAPSAAEENAKKLTARIEKIMSDGVPVDESRLATEIAVMADKICVDEELVRIGTHIENMRAMLESSAPIGRKADFLIQELNREFNTTGSKSSDSRITELVIAGKAEIEKMREQIQNIE